MELLCMQRRGIGPHIVQGESLMAFPTSVRNLGYIYRKRLGEPFKIHVCSEMSGQLPSCEEHFRILPGQGITIGNPIQVRWRHRVPVHLTQGNWGSYQFSRLLRYHLILKH